jgi:hypothetical protein
LPGCTGTLIWKYRASSPASDRDAISPLGQLGREPLQTDVGKTDRRHRAVQMRRPTWQNGQRGKNPISVNFSGLCHHLHCVIMAITTLSSKDLHLFVYGVFKRLEFR